ncbi:hypothetical protein PF005_g8759 [Phytophthora fragariae]|uniref:Uncharacterized protein n=1 Tax=Phytophthora fragariae TaxID=53985 RepID=A0A6A3F8N9_9STRA|nr:hypothetical protein PF003_g39443 [Phytophthora fragariae]KAE8941006.1 hypothetical protein PF009_g9193 [Phytophthora fragariae]KAE8967474.1 hypothetical protein PF011_g27548 [Phytophthora fragariae]KAE9102928.1 hypothetical protein PF007_g14578 [Phytophthora fragariae]KAE9142028.1 hypothetical protein PF006_g12830 [Phytophthora fragariae]
MTPPTNVPAPLRASSAVTVLAATSSPVNSTDCPCSSDQRPLVTSFTFTLPPRAPLPSAVPYAKPTTPKTPGRR